MQHFPEFMGITMALAIGAASPGPSFVMVARTAASAGRLNGMLAAIGMGLGGMAFAAASLLGLHGLLLAVPSVYLLLKIGGGLYLAYLGIKIWRGARHRSMQTFARTALLSPHPDSCFWALPRS